MFKASCLKFSHVITPETDLTGLPEPASKKPLPGLAIKADPVSLRFSCRTWDIFGLPTPLHYRIHTKSYDLLVVLISADCLTRFFRPFQNYRFF
jgi:hypothetical protein